MNKFLLSLALALLAASPLAGRGQSTLENDPAYLPIDKVLDMKAIHPEVNVNLPRFLLKDAASELNALTGVAGAGSGADFAELIKDVKLIRVVVIEANKTNRPAVDKAIKALRAELETKWTAIVSVPEDNVGIYAMGDPSGESMAGVAVLVNDGGEAVIGNVVGHVSIGKLIKIASQMNKLPKDLLKKLQGLANQTGAPPASNDGGATTNKPSDGSESPSKDPVAK